MDEKKQPDTTPTGDDTPSPAPPQSPTDILSEEMKKNLARLLRNVDSIAEAAPNVELITRANLVIVQTELGQFLRTHGTLKEKQDAKALYTVPTDHTHELLQYQHAVDKTRYALTLVPRSLLVAIVSEYDSFLSGLIRIIFSHKPETLHASERQFSFAELNEFTTLGEVRDSVIEKEVEVLLRKSHSEQFEWMEHKFKVSLRKGLAVWPDFVEVTERRNLFVHNSGIVNSSYLKNCRGAGVKCDELLKRAELQASPEYISRARSVVLEIGVKLGVVLWRKVFPEQSGAAEQYLGGYVLYNLNVQNQFDLAINVGLFALNNFKKFESDYFRRMTIINVAQAYKWSGREADCLALIDKDDWSSVHDVFLLATAALRDDNASALKYMRLLGTNGIPPKEGYRVWPLFQRLRKDPEFHKVFEEIFGEPLQLIAVSPEESAPPDSDSTASVH